MKVVVGYSDNPDSLLAGRQAAESALSKNERPDPCDLVLLFGTSRHNLEILREGVVEVVGNTQCIYGGGAVGIITNDEFGYAGDQVGIACIWLDDSKCTVLTEGGLLDGELETGERLGKQLSKLGISPTSPVVLYYDAVDTTRGDLRLLMATWILEGLEKGLGFLPNLAGLGMQGDHSCTPTPQFLGEGMGDHNAFALAFSDDIQMDTVIMHGCRPASRYYTVTKAEGSMILEINGESAISFMDKLLSPALTPEDYPFFLLFGINHGERWGDYNENNYASRLCLDIDIERGGIVMFEPDMVAGTEFQLMYRSLDLDYMKPKLQELFDRLEDRELIFSMYIDCAGRCAGYGGTELEDAFVIQEAVKDRVPLLGVYSGVEIAPLGGRSRGLDWTGVFCIFSKSKDGKEENSNDTAEPAWKTVTTKGKKDEKIPVKAMVDLCEQNAAKVLALDTQSISIRHELEQKRRGFSLLAELSVSLRQGSGKESIFLRATQRINAALNMQKTIVMFPDAEGRFIPSVLQGYTTEEKAELAGKQIEVGEELLDMEHPILVTAADDAGRLAELRNVLKIPYFISAPVVVENKVAAILITGRMVEAPPFLSRLGHNDLETVQAISALLASILVYERLDDANKQAQTDVLTGLLNRGALEQQTTDLLQQELPYGKMSAFIMIDFDYFKEVNDNYGHLVGDEALKALAQALKNNFRATDIVSRLGGDEFAVFCTLTGDVKQITQKVDRLMNNWTSNPLVTDDGIEFYATLSIGISIAPRDGTSYKELLHKADIALYKSKQHGRNRYTIYDSRTMDKV